VQRRPLHAAISTQQVFETALQWFENRPSQELSSLANRTGIALAQYYLERLDEAQGTFVQILRDFPGAPSYVRAFRALTSARLGDHAVEFLREYFTDGGFQNRHLHVPSLRGYPPFEELMRPKG
jgi:hypothetical protein